MPMDVHCRICISVLALFAICSGAGPLEVKFGNTLTFPPVVNASEHFVLNLEPVKVSAFDAHASFYTRAFNGSLPGPTIVARPGDVLNVTLFNRLQQDLDCTAALAKSDLEGEGRFVCKLNHTNFHTHGLHVSPRSNHTTHTVSDDVLVSVLPLSSERVEIHIPDNHMGGTFWYHAHHHHSTAVQAGGGALGAIIVKDPPGSLPDEISNMTDILLVVSLLDLSNSKKLETYGRGTLWKTNLTNKTALVNGQINPSSDLVGGRWYRFRVVYASIRYSLQVGWDGNSNCEMKLLAKDGVYLHQAPRNISTMYLPSGGRADVAIRCTCAEPPCVATLRSKSVTAFPNGLRGGAESSRSPFEFMADDSFSMPLDQVLATFFVTKGTGTEPDLKPFILRRPCYLVNLVGHKADQILNQESSANRHTIRLAGPNFTKGALRHSKFPFIGWDRDGERLVYMNQTYPHAANFPHKVPLPDVHEWTIKGVSDETDDKVIGGGLSEHPFHIHVSPFQIKELPSTSDYFAVGDWHDTFLHGAAGGGWAVVRYQTEKFTGKYVVHCHILEHEDLGMMSWLDVGDDAEEGKEWKAAEEIDPTCYRNASQLSAGPENWWYATVTAATTTAAIDKPIFP